MKRLGLILAALLGLAIQAVPASADAVYTLTCTDVACGSPGTYGTVTLVQLGSGTAGDPTNKVEVTVNLAGAGDNYAGTGAGFAINWNITGNPDLTTNLVPTNATHPLALGEIYDTSHFAIQDNTLGGHTYKASPFGSAWMYAIEYTQNGGTATNDNKLIFDVTKSAGLLLSDFAATAQGFVFAVDIFHGPSGPTFVVASKVGITTHIPEPQTWALFFAGLIGLTVLLRRRKEAKIA